MIGRRPHAKHPEALVLLAGGLMILIYTVIAIEAQAALPSDGVLLTELTPSGMRVAARVEPAVTHLLVGDEIVAIDGRSIWAWTEGTWRGDLPPTWKVGQTLLYQVRRDGVTIDVPVTLHTFPVERVLLVRFGVYASLIAGLVVGSYMLARRPDEQVVHLFFIIAVSGLAASALRFQTLALVSRWLFLGGSLLKFTGRVFLFSATLHLFLIFPVEKVKSTAGKQRLRWIYWIYPAVAMTIGSLSGETPLRRFVLASQVVIWLGVASVIGSVISLAHAYMTTQEPTVRGQIRWIAWGAVIGTMPYVICTALPEILLGRAVLTIDFTAFFFIALPATVAIAVTRYRLFDIDIVMWRTAFYALYGILATGLYLILKSVLTHWLSILPASSSEIYAVFIAAVVSTSVFWGFWQPLMYSAERWLFRTQLQLHAVLNQALEQITSVTRLEQLSTLLKDELPRRIGAASGDLIIVDENNAVLARSGETASRLIDAVVALWEEHDMQPVIRSAPPDWASREVLALMDACAIELAVPLRVGERIVGLWGIGMREDRLSYATADVHLIEMVARQAALMVENARLVQRMQHYQEMLQDEVQSRTQVMENDRNRLNAIVQNMADALLVTDVHERIQLTNPAFENLVRRSHRSLLGHYLADVVPLPRLSEAIKYALTIPGMIHNVDITLVTPQISHTDEPVMVERMLRCAVTALGDKSAVICVLRDVTYEKEVDRMKSGFVSSISHELRTPVTAILGFAKLSSQAFERSIRPSLPDDAGLQKVVDRIVQNLAIMVSEGENLTTLINDILDIAALDAGTLVWQDRPYEPLPMVQDVIERLRESAEAKGLLVEARVAGSLPLLCIDPVRFEQVLGNILSNAIKFTEKGGVTITVESLNAGIVVHEWSVPSAGAVIVSIRDTGVGMSHDVLSNIFQRFWQGEDSVRGKPVGAGLGLAISRDIVVHYGGEIWAESTPGSGSALYFTIPVKTECPATAET